MYVHFELLLHGLHSFDNPSSILQLSRFLHNIRNLDVGQVSCLIAILTLLFVSLPYNLTNLLHAHSSGQ